MSAKDKVQNGCFVAFFIIFGLSFLLMVAMVEKPGKGSSDLVAGLTVCAVFGICLFVIIRWMNKNTPKSKD